VDGRLAMCRAGLAAIMAVLFRAPNTAVIWKSFWPAPGAHFEWHAAALSLVVVLWAYEGWHLSFTAGEVKNPERNLLLSYLYGGLIVILCYVLANIAYYAVLTPAEIRNSATVVSALTNRYGAGQSMARSGMKKVPRPHP